MEIKDILSAWSRQCLQSGDCDACPLAVLCDSQPHTWFNVITDNDVKAIEQCLNQISILTRLEKFKRNYPKAKDNDIIDYVCCKRIGYQEECDQIVASHDNCETCWHKPIDWNEK